MEEECLKSHNPPHFHAIYGEREAQFGIDPIVVLEGNPSNRATSLVIEWAALHQRKLLINWNRLRTNQQVEKIQPLD
jgi:hypothetical protein